MRASLFTVLCLQAALWAADSLVVAQNVHFEGVVRGLPNHNLIAGAKVVAVNPENNMRLDSTFTNASGQYAFSFVFIGTPENLPVDDALLTNPYSNKTQIIANIEQEGLYKLLITGIDGKTLLNTDVKLHPGSNSITLSGGQSGMHIITLSGNNGNKTYKGIQTQSTGSPIQYDLAHTDFSGPILKSGLEDIITVGDEVRLEFSYSNTNPKDSYNSKDTTFIVAPNQTIDQQMQQQEYIFTATLKPFLDNGVPITTLAPGWTTTFEYPAPVGTKIYTPNGNNEIVIQEEFYPLNGELGNVTMHHDTSNYTVNSTVNGVLSWIVLREQNQSTAVRNPVQTSSFDLIPEATTTAPLDSLDGRVLNYYTLPKKAETQPGTWFYLLDARGWMMSSGDGLETSKFIQVPPYGHVVLMSTVYESNINHQTAQNNIDRGVNEYNKGINLTTMANNDNITQPTQFYYTNMNDAIWTELQSRSPPFDNVELMTFDQTSPSVDRFWTNTYTYDGKSRLLFTEARYPESATNGQIFTENYSATYGIEEGSGSLGPYVYIGTTGQPTDLAGRMGRWVKILDLGSGNSKKSSSNSSKPKEVYSYTAEGQAPQYFTHNPE